MNLSSQKKNPALPETKVVVDAAPINGATWPPKGEEGEKRMLVSPALAMEWLDRNYEHQRVLNTEYVRFLITQLVNNRWRYDGSTIVFDIEGNLIDGQHRCHAIVGANIAAKILVCWGVDKEAYKVKDTGRTRIAADSLSVENAKLVAILARSIINYRNYGNPCENNAPKVSNAEIVDLVETDERVADAVLSVNSFKGLRELMSPASAGFGWYMMSQIDPPACRLFWEGISSGVGLGEGDPRLALIRFSRNNGSRGAGWRARRSLIACILKAWNFWRAKKSITVLHFRTGEEFPVAQ